MSFFRKILEWLLKPDVRDKILGGFFAAVLAALFWWVLTKAQRAMKALSQRLFWVIRGGRDPVDVLLEQYRATLDRDLFRVQHAWMKEGQTLADILVPVVIQSDRVAGGIEDWSVVLAKYFRPAAEEKVRARRLALIGGPGSGKSVALKVAAREAWNLPTATGEDTLIPIVLTFSQYRRAGFELINAVVGALESHGFHSTTNDTRDGEMKRFVEKNLIEGKFFVFVDALDELEREHRNQATESLTVDLKRFSQTPAIISCRTAAWHNQFSETGREVVEMADFTPAAIRQFLTQWAFPPPKTSDELIYTIEAQPHIAELGRSPLMLTIIAFLYSQPKYHLPENRAEFYDICNRALLEEWDQHRNPDRANRFERHHKEYVLSELAYRHLCGPTPDADLDERSTLQTIADVLRRYSLKESENLKMLDEIRENSGLLIRLPPSGLRFPHQTFLEFFAALYLNRQGDQSVVFGHYAKDRQRWREVLLLYIGLSTRPDDASLAVARLQETDSAEMALSALVDSRAIKPEVSEDILLKCAKSLEVEPDPKLITLLGYVASNPRTTHSERAAQILRGLLQSVANSGHKLSPAVLETLLLASLRRPMEETTRFVVDHINDLQLGRVLPLMGERSFVLTAKIMSDPHLAKEKKLEWVDGLRRARGIGPLLQLLVQKNIDADVSHACAVALVRLSNSTDFKHVIETQSEMRGLDPSATADCFKRWGWPFIHPTTEGGRRLVVCLGMMIAEDAGMTLGLYKDISTEADPRIRFLAGGLRRENKMPPISEHWPPESSLFVLRSIWKRMDNARWVKWMRWFGEDNGSPIGIVILAMIGLYIWIFGSLVGGWWNITLGLNWPRGLIVIGLGVVVGSGIALHRRDSEEFIFGALLPLGIMSSMFWRPLLLWTVRITVLSLTLAISVLVSDFLPVQIIFGLILGAQLFVAERIRSELPTHPIVANEKTKQLCEELIKADSL